MDGIKYPEGFRGKAPLRNLGDKGVSEAEAHID